MRRWGCGTVGCGGAVRRLAGAGGGDQGRGAPALSGRRGRTFHPESEEPQRRAEEGITLPHVADGSEIRGSASANLADALARISEQQRYGEIIVSTAILSILITAPLGLLVVSKLGPRMLERDEELLEEGAEE